jgi:hypothetical protein
LTLYIHMYILLWYFSFLKSPSSGSLIDTFQWQVQNSVTWYKIQHNQQRVFCYAAAVHYSVYIWYNQIEYLVISKRCSRRFTSSHDGLLLITGPSLHFSCLLGKWIGLLRCSCNELYFFRLKKRKRVARLASLCRTSDFEERVTDIKRQMVVYHMPINFNYHSITNYIFTQNIITKFMLAPYLYSKGISLLSALFHNIVWQQLLSMQWRSV